MVVAAVLGDMLAGRTAVYADLVAYDEVAHHSGPHSPDALKVLERLDRSLGLIAKVAEHAPRAYRIVLLSDHGQSPGETFEGAYGSPSRTSSGPAADCPFRAVRRAPSARRRRATPCGPRCTARWPTTRRSARSPAPTRSCWPRATWG